MFSFLITSSTSVRNLRDSHRAMGRSCSSQLPQSSRYFAFKVSNKFECLFHQLHDVLRFKVAAHEQIVSRQTSHRSPVDYAVFPFRVVAQIGCSQMFNGVECAGVNNRFAVRLLHAYVKCGDGLSAYAVLT